MHYGLIISNVYTVFLYSHYMYWSLVGFALLEDNIANEYQYAGGSYLSQIFWEHENLSG